MKKDNQIATDKNNNSKLRKIVIGMKSFIKATINLSAIVALVFAIMTFNNISNLNELKTHIKERPNSHLAVVEWKKEFEKIKIGYSRDYVESVIGQPQMSEAIDLDRTNYIKTTYSNSYFTLFCVYENDSSLLGYLVIGNDNEFRINNYRCAFSLFDYSINDAENYCFNRGVESILFLSNNHSYRLSSNSYYYECNFQHSEGAVDPFLIGYGICDIGFMNSHNEFYLAANDMHIVDSDYEKRVVEWEKTKNDSIRNLPINSFLIMKYTDESIEVLSNHLITHAYLGMSRSAYANLQEDYSNSINTFINNFEILEK